MADRVRVMIVEAQPLVRSGMRLVLERDPALVLAGDGESVTPAPGIDPDVVILGNGHGSSSIRLVRDRWPTAAVLMLSASADPVLVRRMFELGAMGIVLPTVDDDELLRAVWTVARGDRYVTPGVGAVLAEPDHTRDRVAALSIRERDVLRLLALGLTNQQIAQELIISIRTVEGHRANLMAKLEVTSRAELVRHALRVGLLDDDLARS